MDKRIFVIGRNGKGLMPTTPRKARILLKEKKAHVAYRVPFTIQLDYQTGSATQQLQLGVDTGAAHIGFAITQETEAVTAEVLHKSEVELRSSMEKRKLIVKRAEYRRGRRYRKVRYRHPKFRTATKRTYHVKPDKKGRHWQKEKRQFGTSRQPGWLPPSIQSKVDHHIHWINKYMGILPVDTVLKIEVARFDVQHMQDPSIRGEEYRHGRMYGYENTKAYVLAKFDYKCPVCGHKFDNEHRPRMHHVTFRSQGATDNPDEFAPICEKCHTPGDHLPGKTLDRLRKACKRKEYREPVFMNILRKRLFAAFHDAVFTYGNFTKPDREALGLPKTHANDAVAVSLRGMGTKHVTDNGCVLQARQVRRKKRSLHEANPRKGRKEPNRHAVRNVKNVKVVKGFHVYDAVLVNGQTGYITGFTGTSAYAVDFGGDYIKYLCGDKEYLATPLSKMKLLQVRTNNYISEYVQEGASDS